MCMLVAKVFMRMTAKLREVGDTARGFAAMDMLRQWDKVKKRSASVLIKLAVMFQNCGDKIKNTLEEEKK